jgi:hypothetical protein
METNPFQIGDIYPGQQGGLPELLIKNPALNIKLIRVSGANPEF